jgi:hypothetical protein
MLMAKHSLWDRLFCVFCLSRWLFMFSSPNCLYASLSVVHHCDANTGRLIFVVSLMLILCVMKSCLLRVVYVTAAMNSDIRNLYDHSDVALLCRKTHTMHAPAFTHISI